jgi:16S rRNA (uracil1498-N3)-methyltransferase
VAHTFADSLDDALVIDGPEGHHLARVRRLRAGERITVADGHGRWRPYRVAEAERNTLRLEAAGATVEEPEDVELAIAFAPAKGRHSERVVGALTELGVARIVLLDTERGVVRWPARDVPQVLDRLQRAAREAATLAHRPRLPAIDPPRPVADVVRALGAEPDAVGLVTDLDGAPARVAIDALGAARSIRPVVFVGPEGGWSAAERECFDGLPVITLGPYVLSARHAPIAAAAVVGALLT